MELADLKVTRYAVSDAVATITLVRPERLNAWTGRMHTEYRFLLARAADDGGVRVIVVTGAGRGFCAGADTSALEGHVERGAYDAGTGPELAHPGYGVRPEFDADFAYHFGIGKPIIAAINGPAAGVGFVLACYCDLRFAVAGAKLTTAHGRLGLPAEYGLSWLLPRLVGPHAGGRSAAVESSGPGRRGGGSWGSSTGWWPDEALLETTYRLRPHPGHRDLTGIDGRHQDSRCTSICIATRPAPYAIRRRTGWTR
jgi:hypothetical protein